MTKDIRHVAVVGAGGMGALFGAILSEGGLEVTLVDTDRAHLDAIRRDGLRISGLGGDRRLMLATAHDAVKYCVWERLKSKAEAQGDKRAAVNVTCVTCRATLRQEV